MRVLRLHDEGLLELHEEGVPMVGPGESLVRVTAVGLCGSDLHWFEEGSIGDARIEHPLVLGHEFAGEIADGPDTGLRVAVDPAINCETCRYCLEGNDNLCPGVKFAGHGNTDGALGELIAWPRRLLHPLPTTISDVSGAMLEPLGVAIHAADLGKIRPGKTVAVIGTGPIGLLIIQVAVARGAHVLLATDRRAHRLESARKCGARRTVVVEDETEQLSPLDADVVFEAATSDHALQAALQIVRPGGLVVLVGIPPSDRSVFRASVARRKGVTIRLARRMRNTYSRAIEMVSRGEVDLESMVSHSFGIDDFEHAFATAVRRSGLKVVVYPNSMRDDQ